MTFRTKKGLSVMKVQQVLVALNNANIDLTIRKPSDYKPRKGFKLVHVKYIPDVAPTADATHRILGRGYFWGEKGIKELCYVLEIPANEATPLNRMFENGKAEYRRAHRHKIWNKKRTKLIMCPFTNSCSDCPFKDKPEEIFPSEAEMILSYEDVNQDKVCLPDEHPCAGTWPLLCGVLYAERPSDFYGYGRPCQAAEPHVCL